MYNIQGKKFGRLLVLERASSNAHGEVTWLCQCDCGNLKIVNSYALVHGHAKSCGCYCVERTRQANLKHGETHTRLYRAYTNMMTRCFNSNYKYFNSYGGRGITVCDEWLGENGIINFLNWAKANGYSDNLTLDRIDVNGNYSPQNCRWATMKIQQNNRTNNARYEYKGQIKTLSEWADYLNVTYGRLQRLLQKRTLEEAVEWLKNGARKN